MLATMKPKERTMRAPSHPRTLPHSVPQPRRSRLLFTAILLGGMSILAACETTMSAYERAAMKYSYPGVSDAELDEKWEDMTDGLQDATLRYYERRTGIKPPRRPGDTEGDHGGGDEGESDGGGH